MPTSEAPPLPPPLLPLLPPLLPPQAASVVATVAAATTVTRRREDLDNCSPLCCPGTAARGSQVGGGTSGRALTPRSRGRCSGLTCRAASSAGPRAAGA